MSEKSLKSILVQVFICLLLNVIPVTTLVLSCIGFEKIKNIPEKENYEYYVKEWNKIYLSHILINSISIVLIIFMMIYINFAKSSTCRFTRSPPFSWYVVISIWE